ncbi:WD40-repeat-containing domain protein, partial [Suillus discolor]
MVLKYRKSFTVTHKGDIKCLMLNSSGRLLASTSTDKRVIIWNSTTGVALHFCQGNAPCHALSWTGQDNALHCGFEDGFLISLTANDDLQQLEGEGVLAHKSSVTLMTAHKHDLYLATGSKTEVRIWIRDKPASQQMGTWKYSSNPPEDGFPRGQEVIVTSLHWLYNTGSTTVIVSYRHHGIVCWNIMEGHYNWVMSFPGAIDYASLSPNEHFIATSSSRRGYNIYHIGSNAPIPQAISGSPGEPSYPILFAHEGMALLGRNHKGKWALWDVKSG